MALGRALFTRRHCALSIFPTCLSIVRLSLSRGPHRAPTATVSHACRAWYPLQEQCVARIRTFLLGWSSMKSLSLDSGKSLLSRTQNPCGAAIKAGYMTKRWNLIHRRPFSYLPLLLLAGFVFPSPVTHAQSVSSLSISPNQPSVDIGGTTHLTATATYSDGSSNSVSSSVSWGSADPRIVNVSASGAA
jgi:hypothetical protein